MIRFTGIHLLAVAIALWALAVWRLDAPVNVATAQSGAAPAGQPRESDSGSGRVSLAEAQSTGAPSTPTAPVEDTVPETMVAAVSPPSDPASSAPAAVVPPPTPSESPATGAAVGGKPSLPPAPTWEVPRPSDSVQRPAASVPGDVPRAPAHPPARYEYPPAYSSRPSRPGGGVSGRGNVVAYEFNSARRAAWEGRLADAVDHYRAAARIQPNNYEAWGEMGNVLWQLGRWPEAAYALEGAATLLVQAGELQTASGLVPAVGSLDPDAARRIQERVRAAVQRYPVDSDFAGVNPHRPASGVDRQQPPKAGRRDPGDTLRPRQRIRVLARLESPSARDREPTTPASFRRDADTGARRRAGGSRRR